jgi:uncharacterized protein YndB with AHSA1/START domain
MATPSTSPAPSLQLKRTFKAPRQRVFQAWTEPEQMKHWSAPSDDFEVTAEADLRVGGKYRIQMKHKGGNVHVAFGEYREVKPPEKLVYTWAWEDGSVTDTLVTVEFRDLGRETEVILTHERFTSTDWRDKHSEGWTGCLARLEKLVQE